MRLSTWAHGLRFVRYLWLAAPRPPRPDSVTLQQRLAAFPRAGAPVVRPVEIRWNARLVPFIQAETDRDLAVVLGLVHAHLRLGQMETMRRLAFGRVSEMVGPVALELDRTLRIIDFGRAVPAILARLPDETRDWLGGFVDGINHCLMRTDAKLPHEFALFDLTREPWSVADILTLGRLFASDVMWLAWIRLLGARGGPDWQRTWSRLIAFDTAPIADPATDATLAQALAAASTRSGSNSFAVGSKRADNGVAWIASDSHLGLSLPNNWLLAGYRSPGHHAAGLMLPGMPFVAMGRNPWIAWGGTNLHALASELVDVSDEPEEAFEIREEVTAARWSRPRRVAVRRSAVGPVLSDSAFFRAGSARLALRWVGHQASDEITAMVRMNRARSWTEFRKALEDFAVPGQNMLCAETAGSVGHAIAAWVPKDSPARPEDIVTRLDGGDGRSTFATAASLPARTDPPTGFLVSANDRPADASVVVGRFFSSCERRDRIAAVLGASERIGFETLAALQRDVFSASARTSARKLVVAIRAHGRPLGRRAERLLQRLEAWDGAYDAEGDGAAVFEALLSRLVPDLYPPGILEVYAATWALRDLLREDIETSDPEWLGRAATRALTRTARRFRTRSWGGVHRLRLRHPLGGVPAIGRRYRYLDVPAAGGSETVMKTANGLAAGRHTVRYGSNARHIADLSDPDGNYLVLLGGQDGWFGSENFADQVKLWRQGDYVRVPLRPETARAEFPFVTEISSDD